MCALTIVLLLFPGTALDSLWRLNPEAHAAFMKKAELRRSCLAHRASLFDGRHRLSVIFQHDSTHSRMLAQHAEKWGYRR